MDHKGDIDEDEDSDLDTGPTFHPIAPRLSSPYHNRAMTHVGNEDLDGLLFDVDAFPVDITIGSSGRIQCQEYYGSGTGVESSIRTLHGVEYQSKQSKETLWELAAEILVNDEAALRNIVNKLTKENELLEQLMSPNAGINDMIEAANVFARTNSGFRTQMTSVKSAIDTLSKRMMQEGKDIGSIGSFASHASEESGNLPSSSDFSLGDDDGNSIWGAIDRTSLTSRQTLARPRESSETLSFQVAKVNKYNKNSKRVLQFSAATSSLAICKVGNANEQGVSEIILTPSTLCALIPVPEKPTQLDFDFFKSQDRLLRNKKSFRAEFISSQEREMFFRLIQTSMLNIQQRVAGEKYNPQPLKVTDDKMRGSLRSAKLPIDAVACQLHKSWLMQRLNDGWSYGPDLDQTMKTHPGLVPYEQLNDMEIQRNTQMVSITIESIYALGFEVVKEREAKVDNTEAKVPQELLQLVEFLAENMHDIWAHRKMQEGWKFGEVRDNDKKFHPNLMPYCELSESDRELDRDASYGIIGSLLNLGYSIRKAAAEFKGPE